ncbi:unnamed protein product, partial [Nesidiocoris tenuis]
NNVSPHSGRYRSEVLRGHRQSTVLSILHIDTKGGGGGGCFGDFPPFPSLRCAAVALSPRHVPAVLRRISVCLLSPLGRRTRHVPSPSDARRRPQRIATRFDDYVAHATGSFCSVLYQKLLTAGVPREPVLGVMLCLTDGTLVLLDTSREGSLQWTTYPFGPQATTPGVRIQLGNFIRRGCNRQVTAANKGYRPQPLFYKSSQQRKMLNHLRFVIILRFEPY